MIATFRTTYKKTKLHEVKGKKGEKKERKTKTKTKRSRAQTRRKIIKLPNCKKRMCLDWFSRT